MSGLDSSSYAPVIFDIVTRRQVDCLFIGRSVTRQRLLGWGQIDVQPTIIRSVSNWQAAQYLRQ